MMKKVLCYLVVLLPLVASAQKYKEINLKTFKKYDGDCPSIYFLNQSDAFKGIKEVETHLITMLSGDGKHTLQISVYELKDKYLLRVHDEKDIRAYTDLELKLTNNTELKLKPNTPYGDKYTDKAYHYRSFTISKEQLEQIRDYGLNMVRFSRGTEFMNYEIPYENNGMLKFILQCLLA